MTLAEWPKRSSMKASFGKRQPNVTRWGRVIVLDGGWNAAKSNNKIHWAETGWQFGKRRNENPVEKKEFYGKKSGTRVQIQLTKTIMNKALKWKPLAGFLWKVPSFVNFFYQKEKTLRQNDQHSPLPMSTKLLLPRRSKMVKALIKVLPNNENRSCSSNEMCKCSSFCLMLEKSFIRFSSSKILSSWLMRWSRQRDRPSNKICRCRTIRGSRWTRK